jgi:hypothetical protein
MTNHNLLVIPVQTGLSGQKPLSVGLEFHTDNTWCPGHHAGPLTNNGLHHQCFHQRCEIALTKVHQFPAHDQYIRNRRYGIQLRLVGADKKTVLALNIRVLLLDRAKVVASLALPMGEMA